MARHLTAVIVAATLGTFAALPGAPARAQCVAPPTADGAWSANDGGTYYVRQIGNQFFWLGMSRDDGRSFTNVFHGTRQGDVITGAWADVRGASHGGGTLTLRITGTASMQKTGMTGTFSGSRWGRPCGDVVLHPQ